MSSFGLDEPVYQEAGTCWQERETSQTFVSGQESGLTFAGPCKMPEVCDFIIHLYLSFRDLSHS